MSDSDRRDSAPEDEKAPPQGSKDGASVDEGRRRMLQLAAAGGVAGAATLAALLLHDPKTPVRRSVEAARTMRDHAVSLPSATPKLVLARGPSPAKNAEAALARVGGMGRFVQKGDVVLIKPNVGWDRTAEQAANTNPELIGALVREAKAAGAAKVWVTDCPVNNPERAFTRSGILAATQKAGGKVILPERTRYLDVDIPGKLGRWPVLEPYLEATKIINVPVAKHHALTRATVGMKNWYGILGGQRNRLHQRIDTSIVELAALCKPTLTIVDATRVLLRNGPTGGSLADVKIVNALALSLDPVAADAWGVEILGAKPAEQRWLQLAQKKGLGVIDYRSLGPVELKVNG
jgi:uncharacterized protein (DUF362 family)